jgi:hypothetical protein
MDDQNATTASALSALAALQLLLFIIAAVAVWLLLGAYVLHLHALFAGFLFLWYWGAVEKADFGRLMPAAFGAIVGATLVWQMQALPAQFGLGGLVVSLVVLAAMVFVLLMNWAPLLVNNSTMLFLTVLAAPALISTVKYQDVAISVAAGTFYFGCAAYLAKAYAGARVRAKLGAA